MVSSRKSAKSGKAIASLMIIGWMMGGALAVAQGATDEAKQSAEYKRGRLLYIQCRACHDLQPAVLEKVGPHLGGILGRPVATVSDFNYSTALSGAKFTWDRALLDRWIEKPGAVVPGNTMAFAGVANAADRAALIRYIEIESVRR